MNFSSSAINASLLRTAEKDCCKTAEALVKAGADVKTVDRDGRNILHLAKGWSKDMYKILIEAGVDVNARAFSSEETPLMKCLRYSDYECAELLIEAGADASFTSDRSTSLPTPLFQTYKTNSVKLLLRSGARINIRNNEGLNSLEEVLNYDSTMISEEVKRSCLVRFAAGESVNEVKPSYFCFFRVILELVHVQFRMGRAKCKHC